MSELLDVLAESPMVTPDEAAKKMALYRFEGGIVAWHDIPSAQLGMWAVFQAFLEVDKHDGDTSRHGEEVLALARSMFDEGDPALLFVNDDVLDAARWVDFGTVSPDSDIQAMRRMLGVRLVGAIEATMTDNRQ